MEIDIFQLPGILKKRLHYIVLSVITCIVLAVVYLSTLVPTYRASTDILLDPQGLADRRDLIVAGSSPQEQSSLESQIYIVQSRDVLNEVIGTLSLEQDPFLLKAAKFAPGATPEMRRDAILGALVKHLKVERAGQSFVMTISAEHSDPEKSAAIANTVARTYLRKISDTRTDANRRAGESFQSQAGELRDRVLKAEMAVEDFKAENGLTTTGVQGLLIDQQVSGISEQLTQARVAEEQQKANYDQARNLTVSAIEAGAIPEAAQSQSIELLRSRYTQLMEREAELAAALGTSHPQMRAVRSQLAGARQSINAEIARLRESMRASYERASTNTKALSEQLDRLTRSSFDKGEALTRMRQLESEADAVRSIYKTFLGKAEELGQSQSVDANNSHIISEAVPPSAPPGGLKKIVLAAAGLFGIALGSGLAVLREIFGGNGGGARNILMRSGLPVIANLPATQDKRRESRFGALMNRSGSGKRGKRRDDRRHREIGLLRVAHFLLNNYGGRKMPAAIVFVSPGEDGDEGLVAEIADLLANLGQNVAFAPGDLARVERQHLRSVQPSRGMLATRHDLYEDSDRDLLLADRLVYERLADDAAPPGRYGRRLLPPADIVLVNACGTAACEFLPTLLESSDAIVPISNLDAADRNDVDDLLYTLDPFRPKTPGQIVIGKDA